MGLMLVNNVGIIFNLHLSACCNKYMLVLAGCKFCHEYNICVSLFIIKFIS